jgi:hypothetical protein
MTLATADRRPFVARLHEAKQKHLKEMVLMGEIPLRTGGLLANHVSSVVIIHVACCIVVQFASVQDGFAAV